MVSSCVCFGGSGEGYTLLELLGVDGGAYIGSTIEMSDGNRYSNLEGYPLGMCTFCSEVGIKVSDSVRTSNDIR